MTGGDAADTQYKDFNTAYRSLNFVSTATKTILINNVQRQNEEDTPILRVDNDERKNILEINKQFRQLI